MLKEELHARVHGIVHGVGFRATAKRFADQLNLRGFVRNVPDGTVEICAQGERKNLDRFLELLKEEFGPQHIRHIDISYISTDTSYPDFKILRMP